jgi:predicted GNAT superfamily acetyltransferase
VSLRTEEPPLTQAAPARGGPELVVRDIDGPEEMSSCVALYNDVMGLRPDDGSINPRLLIALQANSGIVLGAYAGSELVGFTYSFLALEQAPVRRVYQYSQLAVVAREHQGKRVGRRLKQAQRSRCLAEGTTLMRWAFDPLKTRNAHFNLDVLGGRVTELVPAMYGTGGFGADAGETTDRFIVTWHLDETPPATTPPEPFAAAPDWSPGQVHRHGDDWLVVLPDDWQRHRAQVGAAAAAELRDGLRRTFTNLLTEHAAVSCGRIGGGLAAYRFRADRSQSRHQHHTRHTHQES